MRVSTGVEAYYAGVGEVHHVKVTYPKAGPRGTVKGWMVAGVNGPTGIVGHVSKYDLYETVEEATKAAFVKQLKGGK